MTCPKCGAKLRMKDRSKEFGHYHVEYTCINGDFSQNDCDLEEESESNHQS